MLCLLHVGKSTSAIISWCAAGVVVLAGIVVSVYVLISLVRLIIRFKQWLSDTGRHRLHTLLNQLRGYLVTVLGGYDPTKVNWLIYRAALLSQQASSGKYSPGMKHVIGTQVELTQQAICMLDKTYEERFRCKPGVRRVEIINGKAEGMVIAGTDPKDGEICDGYLLAAPPGSRG